MKCERRHRALGRAARSKLRALDEVDLVEDQDLGLAQLGSLSRMASPSSSSPLRASRRNHVRVPAPPQAEVTMARSSRRRGLKMPGVSTNTIWVVPSIAIPARAPAWSAPCGTRSTPSSPRSVEKGGLAGVRRPDQGREARPRRPACRCWALQARPFSSSVQTPSRRRRLRAASCSAARFEVPTPSPLSIPLTRAITRNCGA